MLELGIIMVNGVTLLAAAIGARQMRRAYSDFSLDKKPSRKLKDKDLPSVSVCIPARNEDHALTDCLQSVLLSNYPKLEIIVLDDNSVDNTSVLIKSFAHAGVRFVQGSDLPPSWLGKNYALHGLLKEASGSHVLFLDVDTRLKPNSIADMVNYMTQEEADMVSVMPIREDGIRASMVFSPLRYFWEIIFHSKLSPASAGNAWMVDKKKLKSYGEFYSLKEAIKPESHLASYFANKGRYRFLVSNPSLGVTYEKKWSSQLDTSSRLLYPALGRQWSSATIAIIDLLIFLAPLLVAVALLGVIDSFLWLLSLASVVALTALYVSYTKRVWRFGWWVGAFVWPVVLVQEIALIVSSFIAYSRNKVTWKGRPVKSEAQS